MYKDNEIYDLLSQYRLVGKVALACIVHRNTVYNALVAKTSSDSLTQRIRETALAAIEKKEGKIREATTAALEAI